MEWFVVCHTGLGLVVLDCQLKSSACLALGWFGLQAREQTRAGSLSIFLM